MQRTTSQDWVKTIEGGKGYSAVETGMFRRLLDRMPTYAIFRMLTKYVQKGQYVLEAGCGYGLSSFALAESGTDVTAIDISEKLVKDLNMLKETLGGSIKEHLTVRVGDIFRLKELMQTFDVVFSDGTYEHFLNADDRKNILDQTHSVLKNGGICFIAVPNLKNPFFSSVVDAKMPAMHPFTVKNLAKEMKESGFDVLETGYSFVNPGFEQWVKSQWMISVIRVANSVFGFLPRPVQKMMAAHLYCVARSSRSMSLLREQ